MQSPTPHRENAVSPQKAARRILGAVLRIALVACLFGTLAIGGAQRANAQADEAATSSPSNPQSAAPASRDTQHTDAAGPHGEPTTAPHQEAAAESDHRTAPPRADTAHTTTPHDASFDHSHRDSPSPSKASDNAPPPSMPNQGAVPTTPAPTTWYNISSYPVSVPGFPGTASSIPARATGRILRERTEDHRTITRQYRLTTIRTTIIHRGQHTYTLDDKVHKELTVQLQFAAASSDDDTIDVTVLKSSTSPAADSGTQSQPLLRGVELPHQNAHLTCRQDQFHIQCTDAKTDKPLPWPQWAPLDFNPWLNNTDVEIDQTWQLAPDGLRSIGWLDGGQTGYQIEFVVSDTHPQHTHAVGTLENANSQLLLDDQPYASPIDGKITIDFDSQLGLLSRFDAQATDDIQAQRVWNKNDYTWHRHTDVHLYIVSSSAAIDGNISSQPKNSAAVPQNDAALNDTGM